MLGPRDQWCNIRKTLAERHVFASKRCLGSTLSMFRPTLLLYIDTYLGQDGGDS